MFYIVAQFPQNGKRFLQKENGPPKDDPQKLFGYICDRIR